MSPMRGGRRGRLAYKLLGLFLAMSLAPVLIASYELVSSAKGALRRTLLKDEVSLALTLADTSHDFVENFQSYLAGLASFGGFWGLGPQRQKAELRRLMDIHSAFKSLMIMDARGNVVVRVEGDESASAAAAPSNYAGEDLFTRAFSHGHFMGDLIRIRGLYPEAYVSVAIKNPDPSASTPAGVLAGRVSLSGLSKLLAIGLPLGAGKLAQVATEEGLVVAASNPKLAYQKGAKLDPSLMAVLANRLPNDTKPISRVITTTDGRSVLAAFAFVPSLGWIVYMEEPLSVISESVSYMSGRIWRVVMLGGAIAVLLSFFFAHLITQPLRELRGAAANLAMGRFEAELRLTPSNDEIGELGQTFLAMNESLREKTEELVSAKDELEKLTENLERRVEARTRELKAAQDELIKKERLAAIGQMASVVGHEIRNPLAVINNSTYFIKAKLAKVLEAEPKIAKHIKIIESEIQQANGIINEILTYSRQRELKPERTPLNSFLDEILSLYPFPPHIKLVKHFQASNPVIDVDKTEIQQAIRNLIGNAVEIMPQGGVIGVKTSVAESAASIEIADSGPGMPKDVVDKIFTPFFTTKARGTGLGLAVVRKVMDRHKGKVEVQSIPGKGTSFRLTIPLASAHAPAAEGRTA